MENEDEHSLEAVEYGEEVSHDNRGLVDEEEAEGPRESEQTQQSKRSHDPGSEGQIIKSTKRRHIQHERHLVIREDDEWVYNPHYYEKLGKQAVNQARGKQ